MQWQLVAMTILVGMFALLVAWGRYIYYGLRLERYLRAHHRGLWDSIAAPSPFSVEPVVTPFRAIRFVFGPEQREDSELEGMRLQARRAMIVAFISVAAFFVTFLTVLAVYNLHLSRLR